MNLKITDKDLIAFCKKYPSFSIEKLAIDYVRGVSSLNLCNVSDFVPYITSTIKTEFETMQDNISETIKTVPNDFLVELINKTAVETKDSLRNTPNEMTIQTLRDISTRLYSVVTPESLRNIPNDSTMSTLNSILAYTSKSDDVVLQILNNLNEYTCQFKNSSVKGRNTEVKTIMQLDNVFPKHDIQSVPSSKQKGKMDMILSLENHPNISIDTKNYTKAVPKSEVHKFEGDITIGNTHGIMVSISSKITSKPHFTIDIIQGNIAVYLSNTNGDTECIKVAVDIIYNLSKVLFKSGQNTISDDTLAKIKMIIQNDIVTMDKIKASMMYSIELIKEMTFSRITDLMN